MRKICSFGATALALAAFLPASVFAGSLFQPVNTFMPHGLVIHVADGIAYPPPPPPGTVRPEFSQENIQAEVDLQLKERYAAATKDGTKPLTVDRANAVGWGFIADNFAAIDIGKNGIVSLNEISAYLDGRSAVPVERKATIPAVQIVE